MGNPQQVLECSGQMPLSMSAWGSCPLKARTSHGNPEQGMMQMTGRMQKAKHECLDVGAG